MGQARRGRQRPGKEGEQYFFPDLEDLSISRGLKNNFLFRGLGAISPDRPDLVIRFGDLKLYLWIDFSSELFNFRDLQGFPSLRRYTARGPVLVLDCTTVS